MQLSASNGAVSFTHSVLEATEILSYFAYIFIDIVRQPRNPLSLIFISTTDTLMLLPFTFYLKKYLKNGAVPTIKDSKVREKKIDNRRRYKNSL